MVAGQPASGLVRVRRLGLRLGLGSGSGLGLGFGLGLGLGLGLAEELTPKSKDCTRSASTR